MRLDHEAARARRLAHRLAEPLLRRLVRRNIWRDYRRLKALLERRP